MTRFPRIDTLGLDGLLVRFGETLTEPANRAAIAFGASVQRDPPDGVEEVSTSLVSTYLRFDPLAVTLETLSAALSARMQAQDWFAAPLPEGRKRVTIPTLYGTQRAPQLAEAASMAGMSEAEAIDSLSRAAPRVLAIGFSPGQPYLGTLPEAWDIPRQSGLTPSVPVGALVVAIRQFVLFGVSAPTGWRQVGSTAAKLYAPEAAEPFLLRPGYEVRFPAVNAETFARMEAAEGGGVTVEPL